MPSASDPSPDAAVTQLRDRGRPPLNLQDPAEVARAIAQITSELCLMSRSARLNGLTYFLEMARIEATTQAGTPRRR